MSLPRSHKWAVLFAITTTQFAAPFMISAVGVALPVIGVEFQAHGVALSLVESVFLGVSAMCLLVFGRASDMMGRSAFFIVGLTIFSLSTFALGCVQSIESLIAVRAVQAVGGSMQVATGLAILFEVFPLEERGKALGVALAGVYLGVSAGPFVGGMITSFWGWRWVFFIGVVPCLVAWGLVVRALKNDFHRCDEPFDFIGSFLSMASIGLLVYGGANTDTPFGLFALGAALAVFGLFLLLESKRTHPLLDLSMFKGNPSFNAGNLVQFLNYSASFGITFLMSLYLQFGHGMTPAEAGRVLMIQPLIQSVLSPICGRLADRYPPKPLVSGGMFLSVIALGWASTFDAQTSMNAILAVLSIMGVGLAMFASPNMNMIMGTVQPNQYGIATAVTGQMRMFGMTFGMVAISIAISSTVGDTVLDTTAFSGFNRAMRLVLQGFFCIGIVGTAVSLFVRNRPVLAGQDGRME